MTVERTVIITIARPPRPTRSPGPVGRSGHRRRSPAEGVREPACFELEEGRESEAHFHVLHLIVAHAVVVVQSHVHEEIIGDGYFLAKKYDNNITAELAPANCFIDDYVIQVTTTANYQIEKTKLMLTFIVPTTFANQSAFETYFGDNELEWEATVKRYLIVQTEGGRQISRQIKHYNLDMIISIGYRIKSHIATHFRQWATQQLKEYIVKGFVLDDERLKNPDHPFNYFDELLRRIQDIRTSERRFYQKITDIYATSVDYDPANEVSLTFFKTVQNKMHWAITGQTAAEIIHSRVDADTPDLGLTNYRGTKVRKQDVAIAKNYLNEDELAALNNLAEQYLIFAEGQALRRVPMHMSDWIKKLDAFLTINDRNILDHAGKISHEMAKQQAESEYDIFNKKLISARDTQLSDFDKVVERIGSKQKHGGKG